MESLKTDLEAQTVQKDTYKIAYMIHFLLGAGNLLPWNALITAINYFGYLYSEKHMEKVFSVAYMSSSLLVLVVMIKWSNLSRKVSFRGRMNIGFTMFLISLMVTPTLGGSRFYVIVASVVVCGLADGLIGGSLIGSAGKLPKEYMQAILLELHHQPGGRPPCQSIRLKKKRTLLHHSQNNHFNDVPSLL
ncbi:equilibrative nucleotide transporter 8-like protein [Tanacetum coccineum]